MNLWFGRGMYCATVLIRVSWAAWGYVQPGALHCNMCLWLFASSVSAFMMWVHQMFVIASRLTRMFDTPVSMTAYCSVIATEWGSHDTKGKRLCSLFWWLLFLWRVTQWTLNVPVVRGPTHWSTSGAWVSHPAPSAHSICAYVELSLAQLKHDGLLLSTF
jgi:hypothetical protein